MLSSDVQERVNIIKAPNLLGDVFQMQIFQQTLLGIKTLLIHCTVRTYEKWKRKSPKDIIYCTACTYEKWKRKLPKDI
jgi:hypothetical protein